MNINADFSQRVVLNTHEMEWVASPMAGVERKMLDRMGAESGHATSVVRYAPESFFAPHTHSGGEEFLVLDGIFSDEHGDFPTGSYVRNPIGTRHKPFSETGCTIFVKLWQFDEKDKEQFVVNCHEAEWETVDDGIHTLFLHQYGNEHVYMLKLKAGSEYTIDENVKGTELLLLEGSINESGETFPAGTWMRNPIAYASRIKAVDDVLLYLKTGHLK